MNNEHEETPRFCKFDFRDWLTSQAVRGMTYEAKGVYIDLLGIAWCSSTCSIPDDEKILAAMVGMDPERFCLLFRASREQAWCKHPTIPGRLIQRRLYESWIEAKEATSRAKERGKAGGKAKGEAVKSKSGKDSCLVSRASREQVCLLSSNKEERDKKKELKTPPTPISASVDGPDSANGTGKKNDEADENGLTPGADPKQTECVADERFAEFWSEYPNKVAKPTALKSYRKAIEGGTEHDEIMQGLRRWKGCETWNRDNGRFIPYPATWLNQQRWADDVQPNKPTSGPTRSNEPRRDARDEEY